MDGGRVYFSTAPIGKDSFAFCVNLASFVNSSYRFLGSGIDGGHNLFITHMIVGCGKVIRQIPPL